VLLPGGAVGWHTVARSEHHHHLVAEICGWHRVPALFPAYLEKTTKRWPAVALAMRCLGSPSSLCPPHCRVSSALLLPRPVLLLEGMHRQQTANRARSAYWRAVTKGAWVNSL